VCWAPSRSDQQRTPRAKKKRKSGATDAIQDLELIAIGTTAGSVLLYSVTKAELHTQMSGGHTDAVTGICWSSDSETLYSCSTDRHIVEWDVATASVRHKWKGDKGLLYSIHLCHTQRHLVTASRTIKLWDLNTRQLLQTFVGHATEVFTLYQVPASSSYSKAFLSSSSHNGIDEVGGRQQIEGSYIISAAQGDRKICVWQVSSSTNETSSCKDVTASFSLSEDPVLMHVQTPSSETQPFQLAAVTQSGKLSVFEQVLNGRLKKPLQPKYVVEVATSASRPGEVPRPLAIIAAVLMGESDGTSLVVVYEDFLRPVFEKLNMKDLQRPRTCLIREDPGHAAPVSVTESVSKVRAVQVSKDLTVLTPSHMAPNAPVQADTTSSTAMATKKKRRKSTEMSLEERLNAIDNAGTTVSSQAAAGQTMPKTDSLAVLLQQGLQSKDKKILNNVLQRTDGAFIRNTVSRLSPSVVVVLVKELTQRMHGHAQSQRTVLLWVNSVLTIHKSFLTSLPDVDELLHPLRQLMHTPTELLDRLMQVNSQLKSFLSQGVTTAEESNLSSQTALTTYHEESSDDEMALEDMNHDDVISEDEWDNIDESDDNENLTGDEDDKESDREHNDNDDNDSLT